MTDLSPVGQQIQEALATSLQREHSMINPGDHLRDDLGLDSLMLFEWLYELEKTFDLEIPNEDLPALQTVGDVITYVEARVAPSTPSASPTSVPRPSPTLNNTSAPSTPQARPVGKVRKVGKHKAAPKGKGRKP